ncbi:MAG: YeeE/YedE family protein [Deltaproteobacteria bacterium]|nr:YeeE/YedE family protein [Deltaproteobacteria bacterium]
METNIDAIPALLGGLLIGLGLAGMLVGAGRIAGVSGTLGGLLRRPRGETAWRLAFLAGMLAGGAAMGLARPEAFEAPAGSDAVLAVSGLLVGIGTRIGNGCTSGHGICGMSRLSPRSVAATLTFMLVGAATATVLGAA